MVRIYAAKVDLTVPLSVFQPFLADIDKQKREAIARYKFEKDALSSLYGELLLRYGLQQAYDIRSQHLRVLYNNYQKPYLKDYPGIQYNISHSGEYVVCAISHEEVGIDIQQNKFSHQKDALGISRRFFTAQEYEAMMKSQDIMSFFCTLWALKESYIKYKGKGLHIPLDSFWFDIEPEGRILFQQDGLAEAAPEFSLFSVAQGYAGAICTKEFNGDCRVQLLDSEIKAYLGERYRVFF